MSFFRYTIFFFFAIASRSQNIARKSFRRSSVADLHVKQNENNEAGNEGELTFDACGAGQAALEQVVARFLVVHDVLEF